MLSSNINVPTHCHQDSVDDSLKHPAAINGQFKHISNCSRFVDGDKVQGLLSKHCSDKNSCDLPLLDVLDPQFSGAEQTLNTGECGDDAYFFLQAPCLFPSSQFVWRQLVGLTVACWAVFIYFFTLTFFQYIRCVQENKYIDWDIKTITAADYTVEFDLDKRIFE